MENKKWTSFQSILVMAIIFVIFLYIGIDFFQAKPEIRKDIDSMKVEYRALSTYLDNKIPEIDSALKDQAKKINLQGEDIESLNKKVKSLADSTGMQKKP